MRIIGIDIVKGSTAVIHNLEPEGSGGQDQGDRNFYTHFRNNILTNGRDPPCKA